MTFSNRTARLIGIGLCVVAVIVGAYFIFRERVLNALGLVLLLACPLMHFFMHGTHRRADHRHVDPSLER